MNTVGLQATAVVGKNSVAFVEQMFALYEVRRPLVIVAGEAQAGKLPGVVVDRCIVPEDRSGWFSGRHPLIHDDSPAQVTYTSGTEGLPKGIVLTYANLADAAERIIQQMQMTQDIREYVGVPATFSFGMARYRAIAAVGGRAYLPPRGFDPLELARMLAAGEVNALSAVPTLLRTLLASPEVIGAAGKKLRWMEIGSQQMTADEKRRIRELFPHALIVQHYGLTEASRTTFLKISDAPMELLESVGQPVGKTEVRMRPDGRIMIRGPHVAKSRIDAEGLHDLRDADGWLQTNDLGHTRDGYVFFDGRADDLINCGGVKIVPDQLEDRIRSRLEAGTQIAVAKIPDAQRGEGVLVAVKADASETARVRSAALAALKDMGIDAGSALQVMAVDAIPVTGTGKTQRKVLSAQFVAQRPQEAPLNSLSADSVVDVLSLFRFEFPGQKVEPDDTFESLGGDSLHYIQFSLSFEQRFGPLPDNWERLSASELQRHVGVARKSFWQRLESVTATRAFFMTCIVALHTDAFVYSSNWGAAYFLVLLAGYSVARWQLPEIIRAGKVTTLLRTIRYVAIPTVIMVALLQVATRRFEITPLLLISNYLDPVRLKGFLFYFMEFYIQLLLLVALLFSFARVRRWFQQRPMFSALALLVVVVLIDRTIEAFWNTDYNYHRVPWHYAWPFALGMILASANDLRTRCLAMGVSLMAVWIMWGFTSAAFYFAGGCVLVLFVRNLIVPAPVKLAVAEIASASMFIYLSHSQMISIVEKVFGHPRPWLELISATIVGIALAHGYAWCERRFAQLRESMREPVAVGS
ncbi:AMP-binding protein [Hydrogenophaga laconesensis]|uniref:Non-ribosomal peptide synthetase component E (Peptide arylation enzyme)/peptidoglycan/LPS O-acetylase OafA/YrhL n=1 Tax=Hydrogenophaga laconesensis TaxID=1805971 RepID=A0ABU1V5L9_9BURK|nr:AMP-binding protein [Hydrogenophaga laconesensis]MDR7092757.1 non-ribosomal peptide synthetase component E (peptide arylation enzyme)/peptidoglycan/LPS O-acetylase OafA/YrhL [Hydrogenophaga laconesensis]